MQNEIQNFFSQAEDQMDIVCEWYVRCGLSATQFGGGQLALSLCSARIALEADTRLNVALGLPEECRAETPLKVLCKTEQIGY